MNNIYMLQLSVSYTKELCDTGNVREKNEYYLPYSVGVLWSYVFQNDTIKKNYCLKSIDFKIDDIDEYVNSLDDPKIFAVSNALWNSRENLKILNKVKKKFPNCLTVCGGPNVPKDNYDWYRRNRQVDIGVIGEGEVIFEKILINYLEGKSFDDIESIIINLDEEPYYTHDRTQKLNIDYIPSPYLTGLFDSFIESNKFSLVAPFETDRGCPFKCAFCDWGTTTHQKMRKYDFDKVEKELKWFSENKIAHIMFTNSNFGIFKERDLKIAEKAVELKKITGFPSRISHSGYAKTLPEKNSAKEIKKLISDSTHSEINVPRVAIQSLDPEVLKAVDRINIPHKFEEIFEENSEIELIFPLPQLTLDSFKRDLFKFSQFQNCKPRVYPLAILPNSPMGKKEYKEKYKLKSRIFDYQLGEIEIVVATSVMTEEETIFGWMYYWVIMNLLNFIKDAMILYKMKPTYEIMDKLHDYLENVKDTYLSKRYHEMKNSLHRSYEPFNAILSESDRSIFDASESMRNLAIDNVEDFLFLKQICTEDKVEKI